MLRKIEFEPGSNIVSAVNQLLEEKAKGESVYGEFNGHKLYSDTVTIDSAYTEIMGCTKAEFDQRQKEIREKYIRDEQIALERAKANIPLWLERGNALIFPEKYEEWEKLVVARAADLYHGYDLESALEIMEALNSGATIEEAKKIFVDKKHTGVAASIVRRIIFTFSNQGPEFYEATSFAEVSPEDEQIIAAKKQENKLLAEEHANSLESGKHM